MHDYRLDRPVINKKQPSVWYVVWREEGRSRRRSTGSTDKPMARQFLAQYAATQEALPPVNYLGAVTEARFVAVFKTTALLC